MNRSWPSYEEGSVEAAVPSAKGKLMLIKIELGTHLPAPYHGQDCRLLLLYLLQPFIAS